MDILPHFTTLEKAVLALAFAARLLACLLFAAGLFRRKRVESIVAEPVTSGQADMPASEEDSEENDSLDTGALAAAALLRSPFTYVQASCR